MVITLRFRFCRISGSTSSLHERDKTLTLLYFSSTFKRAACDQMFRSLKLKAEATFRRRKDDTLSRPLQGDWDTEMNPASADQEQKLEQDKEQESINIISPRRRSRFDGLVKQHQTVLIRDAELLDSESRQISASDSTGPKYVPFVDNSGMKNNMFAKAPNSYYGAVSPAIMGGFGSDEEPTSLANNREMNEHGPVLQIQGPKEDQNGSASMEHNTKQSAFQYRTNPSILDDGITTTPSHDVKLNPGTDSNAEATRHPLPLADTPGYSGESSASAAQENVRDAFLRPEVQEDNRSATSTPNNPYTALLENQEVAMTLAYMRRLDLLSKHENEEAEDFMFGQRYQEVVEASDVVITHQRVPADEPSGDQDCLICSDNKEKQLFPRFSVTTTCTHPPMTCLECLEKSIRSDLNGKLWTEIRCPECREFLDYADIQRYADEETFLRYETLALRAAMSEAENFIWCTSGCGSGQIHESGSEQPIATCLHCGHRSCFHHNVSWHQSLSCDEYDQLLADPENFRSRIEIENEEWTQIQKAQVVADQAMAQERRETQQRQVRQREERDRATKAVALARQIATRRKLEEEQSRETVSRTTKTCPGCGWAIEKNDGCSHMTCTKCKYEFCYECGADYQRILRTDNSAHAEDCRFHSP